MLIALGLFVLAIVVVMAMQIDDWKRDLTINRAATSEDASDLLLRPLDVPASPDEVAAVIDRFVDRSAAWSTNPAGVSKQGDVRQIFLIHTSQLFRFADDVQIFLQSTATGTRIDASSQSRVGRGDFGQNPRNLRELMRALREEFANQ